MKFFRNLALLFSGYVVFSIGLAVAQTCLVAAPVAPPKPNVLIVTLPPNGATVGCTVQAPVSPNVVANQYPVSNAKCAQAVAMATQAAATDNGWNDGGVP